MDNVNKINAIMYGKFNNRDKHASLLYASSKGGLVVINKPFKEVLDAVTTAANVENDNVAITDNTEELELTLLWQKQIHENYLRTRKGGDAEYHENNGAQRMNNLKNRR